MMVNDCAGVPSGPSGRMAEVGCDAVRFSEPVKSAPDTG